MVIKAINMLLVLITGVQAMNIGYIRVSTEEQSTARQLDGVLLDMTFEDKISGATKERPKLSECLIVLRKGDTLHVHSIDRLARSQRHLLELLDDLLLREVRVHFHKENLLFDGNRDNPMSTLMLQLLGAVAQFERTNMKERQKEGIAATKKYGTKSGKPFGQVPLDMNRRDEALCLYKDGKTITYIASVMKLSRPSIRKLLA